FGAFGPLTVRHEVVGLGLGRPLRLLYAADLHLGHWWTRAVPGRLLDVCLRTEPDLILLGGDLADHPAARAGRGASAAAVAAGAPGGAGPGNPDGRTGVAGVRAAVEAGGGRWLPAGPLTEPLPVDAEVAGPAAGPRLLCAHYPDVFPAAARA